MNIFFHFKKRTPHYLLIVGIASIFLLNGCSSSYGRGEALLPGDEMKKGPGIFSGEKGGFYLVGGSKKVVAHEPFSSMSASNTSKLIDERLEKLKQDQIELEELKRNLNNKLQN